MLVCATTLFGCGKDAVDVKDQNNQFSYNIIQKQGTLTKEEIIANNLNEILNASRGYITAWDKGDTTFMNSVLNDTVNDTVNENLSKEDFIKSYKKDAQRFVMRKYITKVTVLSYSNKNTKVQIQDNLKKSNPFTFYRNGKEEMTFTFINKNNKWVITDINTVVK